MGSLVSRSWHGGVGLDTHSWIDRLGSSHQEAAIIGWSMGDYFSLSLSSFCADDDTYNDADDDQSSDHDTCDASSRDTYSRRRAGGGVTNTIGAIC